MPGGSLAFPPDNILRGVESAVPKFPLDKFQTIAAMFNAERLHAPEHPPQVRKKMERILRLAAGLRTELQTLSEEAYAAFFEAGLKAGQPRIGDYLQMLSLLTHTTMGAEQANLEPPTGRKQAALATLVSRLAGAMDSAGLTVDARPTGDLVFLTRQVLAAYGQSQDAALKAVQRHLDKTRP